MGVTNGLTTLQLNFYRIKQHRIRGVLVHGTIEDGHHPILILLLVCHHVMAGTKSSWKQVDVFPIFSFITQYISYILTLKSDLKQVGSGCRSNIHAYPRMMSQALAFN